MHRNRRRERHGVESGATFFEKLLALTLRRSSLSSSFQLRTFSAFLMVQNVHIGLVRLSGAHTHLFTMRTLGDPST